MTSSGEGTSPQTGMQSGEIAGLVIGLLIAIILVAVLVIYIRKRTSSYSLRFSPFPKKSNDNYGNPLFDIDINEKTQQGTENPPLSSTAITGLPSSSGTLQKFASTFENPLYEEEDV
ncbi:uncharacterized protein LOC113474592 [Ciona intestinalis]